MHRRAQQPCPGTGQRPQALQLRKLHSFLRAPTRAPVVAQQQAHDNHPQNCTFEGPRSAAQCALCVPRSACSWNVHHSADELKHIRVHEQRLLELMLHVHRDIPRRPEFFPTWSGGGTSQALSELFTPLCKIVDATLHIKHHFLEIIMAAVLLFSNTKLVSASKSRPRLSNFTPSSATSNDVSLNSERCSCGSTSIVCVSCLSWPSSSACPRLANQSTWFTKDSACSNLTTVSRSTSATRSERAAQAALATGPSPPLWPPNCPPQTPAIPAPESRPRETRHCAPRSPPERPHQRSQKEQESGHVLPPADPATSPCAHDLGTIATHD